jgi:hypothetical protein
MSIDKEELFQSFLGPIPRPFAKWAQVGPFFKKLLFGNSVQAHLEASRAEASRPFAKWAQVGPTPR